MNCETTFSMLSQSKSKKTNVVISKGNTPKESLLKGIEKLGGISNYISKDDQVFIKFNLNLPGGFPTNTNYDVLEALIIACKEAGADKIYLGSFPIKGIPIKIISDLLNLKEYFETLGAELIFLDNSDLFEDKNIDQDQLKKIKYESLSKVIINDNEFFIPKLILNSNKFISVNQINVNPLFKLNLALLNLYSILPPKYQAVGKNIGENISLDQYKKNLISNILDIYAIKQPDLIINDLFYILEDAGPYIYKDSKIKKTRLMVLGDDTIAVDMITLKILNIEINSSELISGIQNKNIDSPQFSNIKILGEKVEDTQIDIGLCVSELEDIKTKNFIINSGKKCSGCFKQAYHLLNFMKSYMGKDLKYNINNSFLIGERPPEPNKAKNYFIFGDCAINTTKNYDFRTAIIESKKDLITGAKNKILKKSKSKKKATIKRKSNKNILELHGCPPNIVNCLELILKYFGKKNLPNLNLMTNVNEYWMTDQLKNKLKLWEEL
ncbi:MAG: DUF362 domain-containing protein [Promethearchaeota archaeon]